MGEGRPGRGRTRGMLLLLALATLWAFQPLADNGFVGFDDDRYIVENGWVRAGVTWEGLRWSFTNLGYASNWHPLTWISHMLDVQLFGLDPRGHHLVSLGLHLLNALLMFAILVDLTGERWRSFLVAALFAVHPLHVESVAWAAERKDVLSTLFGLLAVGAYLRHVRRATPGFPWLAAATFAASLLAKQMLVTLPFLLLLLDYWPLGRFRAGGLRRPLLEKAPLLALSGAAAALAWLAQQQGKAVVPLGALPLLERVANALGACVAYVMKALWPAKLAVFYPFPALELPATALAALAAVLVALTALAVRLRCRRPHLLVGWLWYLVMLLPVIGLVQVGRQAMADRYTYLSLTGLFLLVAWSLPGAAAVQRRGRVLVAAGAAASLLLFAGLTRGQVRHWRDGATLFEHSLAVTGDNALARSNLASVLYEQGRYADVVDRLRASLRANPQSAMIKVNLAGALYQRGSVDEAIELYRQAIAATPAHPEVYNNLGCALFGKGAVDEAVGAWREALRINPGYANAHFNLAQVLESRGARDDARFHYRETLRAQPTHSRARAGLERLR